MTEKDIRTITELVDKYCKAVNTQEKDDVSSIFSLKGKCTLISVSKIFDGLDKYTLYFIPFIIFLLHNISYKKINCILFFIFYFFMYLV